MTDDLIGRLDALNGTLYTYGLIGLLLGGGVVFTVRTRCVQVRHFGRMIQYTLRSRRGAEGGISSFQAFAIGMATRIGIGNITGVALALILGGPGAILWMWVVAAVGMATSFTEATLAQVFKVRWPDGTYRGGPAYYLTVGLRSRSWGVLFAVLLIFAMVIAMSMVQANTIAVALNSGHGVPPWVSALVLMVLTAAVVFAGVRGVARAAEIMTPLMAAAYLLIAFVVVGMNIGSAPAFLSDILAGAFGLRAGLAGVGGGVVAALLNGAQRGLFTNEAGMGTNPNAAATATVAHPVPGIHPEPRRIRRLDHHLYGDGVHHLVDRPGGVSAGRDRAKERGGADHERGHPPARLRDGLADDHHDLLFRVLLDPGGVRIRPGQRRLPDRAGPSSLGARGRHRGDDRDRVGAGAHDSMGVHGHRDGADHPREPDRTDRAVRLGRRAATRLRAPVARRRGPGVRLDG